VQPTRFDKSVSGSKSTNRVAGLEEKMPGKKPLAVSTEVIRLLISR